MCFFFAFMGLPWLPVRPAKFALAFRCVRSHSLCFCSSFPRTVWEAYWSWLGERIALLELMGSAMLANQLAVLQLFDLGWTYEPHEAFGLQRTSTLLYSVLLQSRTYTILFPRGGLHVLSYYILG